MSADSIPSSDDLQFALQEVRTLLLQQILATETGLLSVAELVYRNRGENDIDEENIRDHLRKLRERNIIEREKLPVGERVGNLPNTFYAVTDYGEQILDHAGLLAEVGIWAQLYDQMDRTDEIEQIERLKQRVWSEPDKIR
jgi:repressor of nif and glnA expression